MLLIYVVGLPSCNIEHRPCHAEYDNPVFQRKKGQLVRTF